MQSLQELQLPLSPSAAQQPLLGCVCLHDLADPGCPSFPVLGAAHLQAFEGQALPSHLFLNQGEAVVLRVLWSFDVQSRKA